MREMTTSPATVIGDWRLMSIGEVGGATGAWAGAELAQRSASFIPYPHSIRQEQALTTCESVYDRLESRRALSTARIVLSILMRRQRAD